MKSLFPISSCALLLLAGAAAADTIQVPRDYTTIQEAVTAASPGDTIVVSAGLYRENVSVTTDDLSLTGRDAIIDGSYSGTCLTVRADGVTVTGLSFVNGGIPANEELVGTDENADVAFSGTGLIARADGVLVSGPAFVPGGTPAILEVVGAGGGLDVEGDRATIRDSNASGCVGFGIRLVGQGSITNCLVAGCLGPGLIADTDDQAGDRMVIANNAVYRCGSGIEADDGPFEFVRNIISNNSGNGIQLTIRAATSHGLPLELTEFTRNQVHGNGGTGLLIIDEVGATSLILKNKSYLNDVGLDITGGNVRIQANDISQNRAGGAFLHTDGATFDKNTLRRNSLCGIMVESYPGHGDAGNLVTNNLVEANGGDGIHVISSSNIIHRNRVRDNLGDGLQVGIHGAANVVTDNLAIDNQHDGIDNWGSATVIRFNESEGSHGADLAGVGNGNGSVDASSGGNNQQDGSGLRSNQELELDTLTP